MTYSLIRGFPQTTTSASLFFLIILSILSGIIISFTIYLISRQIKSGAYAGTSVLVSLIAPACPSCAVGLFGLIGIGGLASILPFKGLEIGFIGVLVVIFSIFYLAKKVETNTCSIKK